MTSEQIESKIKLLQGMVFFQGAKIEALENLCVELAASAHNGEEDQERADLLLRVKLAFAENFSILSSQHPDQAKEMDIRPWIDPEDRDSWYTPRNS